MPSTCYVCGKGPHFGHNVSHANNKTPHKWRPNLQRVRVLEPDGSSRHRNVCAQCLKSGRVRKAA